MVSLAKTPPDEGQALPLPEERSAPRGVRSTSAPSAQSGGSLFRTSILGSQMISVLSSWLCSTARMPSRRTARRAPPLRRGRLRFYRAKCGCRTRRVLLGNSQGHQGKKGRGQNPGPGLAVVYCRSALINVCNCISRFFTQRKSLGLVRIGA